MNRMHNNYSCNGGHAEQPRDGHGAPLPTVSEQYEGISMMMSAAAEADHGSHHMNKQSMPPPRPPHSSDDAPMVTPTVQGRATLSAAFLRQNLLPPPLGVDFKGQRNNNRPQQQSSRSSAPPPLAPSRNPLDLLSLVSTRVAEKENSDMLSRQSSDRSLGEPSNSNSNPSSFEIDGYNDNNQSQPLSRQEPFVGERNHMGQRHGRGIMKYPNGCHYNGCFVNDKRHGFGECWYPNGCVYTGFWSEGKRDGVGKMIYADRGDVYEGEWMADRRHGRGIYFRSDGRADVARYDSHDVVGEGVQWSPNREFSVRLIDGNNRGQISVGVALEICSRVGVPGVPKQMFPEFQSTKSTTR